MKRKILSIIAALSFTTIGVTAQSFTVDYYVPFVGSGRVIISMEDATEIADLQMTLSLPEGFTLNEESIDYGIVQGITTNDHVLSVKPLASGDYLITLYSLGRGIISDGTLFSFPLTIADGASDGEMRLHTIRTSSVDAVSQMCNNVVVPLTEWPVNLIYVKPETVTLVVGDTLTLISGVRPQSATNQERTWSSSDKNIATVDNNGLVTAIAEGVVDIVVEAGGLSDTCVVTVEKEEEPLPVVADGEYYLYNVEEKQFLSRGEYWGTCATVDRYGIPFVWTAEEYSLKFLDSEAHLFETDDSNIYTDNNSTGFAFEEVEGGYLLKSQKSNRYLTIVDAAFTHDIVNVTDDASAAVVWQLKSKAEHDAIVADYVEENYMNVIKAAGLTATAGDFASYLATLIAEDKTSAIGTARFNGSAGDWTFTEVRHQDWQPAYGADFCELWQATGSYTQTITGLAEGIYKVTMQGFERSGSWATCNTLAEKGYEITTATLSANGEETNLKSWYSGKSDESNPNNTDEAVAKFADGLYQNEVYTYVGEDGTLTLTICKPSHVGDNWVLFNNFTLTRYAEGDATGIDMTTDNRQQTTVIYDLTGRKVENPAKGIYIVNGKKVVLK